MPFFLQQRPDPFAARRGAARPAGPRAAESLRTAPPRVS